MPTALRQHYGPWALIAGGSEGIGLCFARELAAAGINLVLLARRQRPLAAAAADLRARYPVAVRSHCLDLASDDVERELAAITDGLEIGLLVYNAGATSGVGQFLDQPLAEARQLLRQNCHGPLVFCHRLGTAMRSRGRGGIILLSSLSGLSGGANIAVYAATKAFAITLAESLWAELATHGVHVLALVAGMTDTPAIAATGVHFAEGQAMAPAAVAREGLLHLPHGPVHVAGEQNRLAANLLRTEERRQAVTMMSAGTAHLYQLAIPELPGS